MQAKKQAALKLKRTAELEAATGRQDDLELAQQEEILRRRQLMWNAQGGSALTKQIMSGSISGWSAQQHTFSLLGFRIRLCCLSQALLKIAYYLQHSQA